MSILRPKWQRIPSQIVGLDSSHPLRRNIKFAMYPGAVGQGIQHLDLHSGEFFTRDNPTRATYKKDKRGGFLSFNPASTTNFSEIELLQPPELKGLTEITVLSGVIRTGNQSSGFGRVISRTNGGSGDDWSTTLNADSGGAAVRWRVNGNSLTGATSLVNGTYYDIANTYKAGERLIVLNGELDASDTLSASLPDDQNISIGAHPSSNSRELTGDIYYVVVLDRAMSLEEVKTFQKNPYQILSPLVLNNYSIDTGPPPATNIPVIMNHLRNQGIS